MLFVTSGTGGSEAEDRRAGGTFVVRRGREGLLDLEGSIFDVVSGLLLKRDED